MNNLASKHYRTFEGVWHEDADSMVVIHRAIKACGHFEIPLTDHFSHLGKMVLLGSGAELQIPSHRLVPPCLLPDCAEWQPSPAN